LTTFDGFNAELFSFSFSFAQRGSEKNGNFFFWLGGGGHQGMIKGRTIDKYSNQQIKITNNNIGTQTNGL
jgi:hypothetical protein